jgi:hypothetical protein
MYIDGSPKHTHRLNDLTTLPSSLATNVDLIANLFILFGLSLEWLLYDTLSDCCSFHDDAESKK